MSVITTADKAFPPPPATLHCSLSWRLRALRALQPPVQPPPAKHSRTPLHAPAPKSWPTYFHGMRLFLPVAISIASYGVVWGVLAGQAGLSPLEVIAMSGIVYAGSSQFVAIDMWAPAAIPIVSIVIATHFPHWLSERRVGTMRAA